AGLAGKGWGGDVAVFDYDEDGYQDLLVTNMFGQSQLYRNNGDGTFTDTTQQVLGRTSWGAIGAKAFDFNNDGKLDLLIVDMHSDMWLPADADRRIAVQHEQRKFPTLAGPPSGRLNFAEVAGKLADIFRVDYGQVVFGNTLFKNLGEGKFV